jgi:hypothetical protein
MATKPKGKTDAKENGPKRAKSTLDAATPDLFGDLPQTTIALDWAVIAPAAVHSIIQRICVLGGYIGFSAPAGGTSVKLVVSVGGSSGQRWCHSDQELSAHVAHLNRILLVLEGK